MPHQPKHQLKPQHSSNGRVQRRCVTVWTSHFSLPLHEIHSCFVTYVHLFTRRRAYIVPSPASIRIGVCAMRQVRVSATTSVAALSSLARVGVSRVPTCPDVLPFSRAYRRRTSKAWTRTQSPQRLHIHSSSLSQPLPLTLLVLFLMSPLLPNLLLTPPILSTSAIL